MAVATLTAAPVGPLSPSQHREVSVAHDRARKIRRAAAVARFNGWGTAVFAALSAPFALFSAAGLFLTAGMALIAYNEFRGRRRLLHFDTGAPALLGWNQIGFLALIVTYSLWMLASGLSAESPFSAELAAKPELRELLGSTEGLERSFRLILTAFYALVIALSVVFQGGNAWYYFRRRRHVVEYLDDTPEWVREVQRSTSRG